MSAWRTAPVRGIWDKAADQPGHADLSVMLGMVPRTGLLWCRSHQRDDQTPDESAAMHTDETLMRQRVLRRYARNDELVSIVRDHTVRSYAYSVRINGGPRDGVVIRCNSIESVVWLAGVVTHALVNNPEWSWLA